MGMNLKKGGGGSGERPEDGSYFVRLIGVVDLDNQPDFAYGEGAAAGVIEGGFKISLSYELVSKQNSDGKNFVQFEEINAKGGERANLTKRMKALDPSGVITQNWTQNIEELVGKTAMLNIGSTASGRAKVAGLSASPADMPIAEATNDTYTFDFDEPIIEEYMKIPKFIQEKLHKAKNFPDSPLHLAMIANGLEDPLATSTQY